MQHLSDPAVYRLTFNPKFCVKDEFTLLWEKDFSSLGVDRKPTLYESYSCDENVNYHVFVT